MSTENSESDLNISPISEPERHDQKQAPESNNTDIMCPKLGQQQVEFIYTELSQPLQYLP